MSLSTEVCEGARRLASGQCWRLGLVARGYSHQCLVLFVVVIVDSLKVQLTCCSRMLIVSDRCKLTVSVSQTKFPLVAKLQSLLAKCVVQNLKICYVTVQQLLYQLEESWWRLSNMDDAPYARPRTLFPTSFKSDMKVCRRRKD